MDGTYHPTGVRDTLPNKQRRIKNCFYVDRSRQSQDYTSSRYRTFADGWGPERVPRGAGAKAATFPRLDFMVSRNHDQITSRYHETTEAACCDR
jgi:hypothetical protein